MDIALCFYKEALALSMEFDKTEIVFSKRKNFFLLPKKHYVEIRARPTFGPEWKTPIEYI